MIGSLIQMRYEISESIDEGPVFHLFRAMDRNNRKEVFLRTLSEGIEPTPAFVDHLRTTVHELSAIQSRQVERFIDVFTEENRAYVVSDGHGGQLLSARIKRLAPYSIPVCISLGLQILDALSVVHEAGFVHGELTSHQVLIGTDGKVSLLQPGLWMAYSSSHAAGAAAMTRLGPYLGPEISQGRMPAPTSDIYAVGCILFELLTARTPFQDDNAGQLARKHATSPVPQLQTLNPSVPGTLEELIRKALSKDPADRYSNARAMLNDLKALQEAIRFGKTLQWPISQPTNAAVETRTEPAPVEKPLQAMAPAPTPAPTPKPVAAPLQPPKDPPPPIKKKREKPPESADRLPGWISFIGYASLMVLIALGAGYYYWNFTAPKPLKVPDLVGKPVQQATKELEAMGLTFRVARKEYNDKKPKDVVLQMNPRPGEAVRENAFVTAVVSAGPRFVKVPDLRGEMLEEARQKLESLELKVADGIEEVYRRRQPEGQIIEQIPEPGSEVDRGTKVRLAIASRRDRKSAEERIRSEYELILRMPYENEAVYVRVDMIDAAGVRTVFQDTLLEPGEVRQILTAGVGSTVDFKIYFNGKLVQQVTKEAKDSDGER